MIKEGYLFAFPTDTVYGLGTRFIDLKGINKIYELKQRSIDKKIPVLFSNIEDILKICIVDEKILKIAKAFWPGALTIILKLKEKISVYDDTIAVRIPDSKIALDLINKYGPLATTSCNLSGKKELKSKKEIIEVFGNNIDFVIDDIENKKSNISSTIISFIDGKLNILREGTIKKEDILKYV